MDVAGDHSLVVGRFPVDGGGHGRVEAIADLPEQRFADVTGDLRRGCRADVEAPVGDFAGVINGVAPDAFGVWVDHDPFGRPGASHDLFDPAGHAASARAAAGQAG